MSIQLSFVKPAVETDVKFTGSDGKHYSIKVGFKYFKRSEIKKMIKETKEIAENSDENEDDVDNSALDVKDKIVYVSNVPVLATDDEGNTKSLKIDTRKNTEVTLDDMLALLLEDTRAYIAITQAFYSQLSGNALESAKTKN